MSDRLREQLQATFGITYALERELDGGGMSRVFVAREEALGREVVIKVIKGDLAEGLSAERFAREVKLGRAPAAGEHRAGAHRGHGGRRAVLHDAVREGRVTAHPHLERDDVQHRRVDGHTA
ncbi:MAG: hypothetical protein ABIT38_18240 [Gemmatimonadaceae bacterium]